MKVIKYFFQYILILTLFLFFKILGYRIASNFGSIIGRSFGKLFRSEKIIIQNLNYISDYTKKNFNKKELINEVFSNYGRILSDYVYLNKFRYGDLKKYVKIEGNNYLEKIKLEKKRVIFVSGHFNNFELMAMFLDASGIKLSAIYRPLNNPFLNRSMERIRKKYICENQIKKGRVGTRELLKYLKDDYSVALMIDQRVSEGIKTNFFGKAAYTTTIPAQVVKKFKYEIVPVYIKRYDNIKFNLEIQKPIKFNNNLSIEEITLELNKLLEKMVMEDPSQWILTHNRWK